ncbi:hypothetical protein L873DRAFT_1130684 [Choiromyces venosus 120613-1]|uniref:Uncharacterized protein n=1 Tax=Choiromyces venosus 120613-1 TaxID=1336337 RepID=A0A3N4JGJ0_9PEZI|nr:hypothetical protein L873DRAFT_1130684 [Choiromyces venosus 120613-1]
MKNLKRKKKKRKEKKEKKRQTPPGSNPLPTPTNHPRRPLCLFFCSLCKSNNLFTLSTFINIKDNPRPRKKEKKRKEKGGKRNRNEYDQRNRNKIKMKKKFGIIQILRTSNKKKNQHRTKRTRQNKGVEVKEEEVYMAMYIDPYNRIDR